MPQTLKTKDWFHADGFPIAVERRHPQEPFARHNHEFAEVVLVTEGRGLHVLGSESWPLTPGDAFVISGHRAHEYREMENLCLVNILFQPARIQLDTGDLTRLPGYHALFTLEPAWRRRHNFKSRLHLSPSEFAVVMSYVDHLDEELRARTPGFRVMATASFLQITAYLSRCYGRAKNPDSRALLRIGEAISHLESHYAEEIDVDRLATIAHMSKRSFIRAFQSAMGNSPIAYLIQTRLNRASEALRQSDQSITEIAFQVGFTDSNYFTRQFTKNFGVSPRLYRRQHQS
ncbi:MAG: helix-turn-helix domain-containing protein [Verrucomicrobia bacterium]|nr:helix-turn-helix domain-containing protein [Verrucomicrobiota bacterium]MBI3871140.1 helix-turn-helix domain-containing protein [Verrucomicrobiota bacterium]